MNPFKPAPSRGITPIAEDVSLETTLRSAIPANDPSSPGHAKVFPRRAARGIQEQCVCVLQYASEPGGATTTRDIEPLAVVSTRGALGLLAWCRLRRDLRTFRVDRVVAIGLTGEHFIGHPGLALERFIPRRR